MKLTIPSFPNGGSIPRPYALGVPDEQNHVRFGENRNPHLRWEYPPPNTCSFAVICHDSDVPSVGDDVNQEGRTVPVDLPRTNFFHWVLVDIPADVREIPEGAVSDGVTPHGKPVGPTEYGKAGRNDYTGWFSGNADMEGEYGGYDGPGPPWNDERLHHYHFTLYALETERLDLPESFSGEEALDAMEGHILAQSEWVGTYAIYENARKG
ncbi:MAG TPA: YbhB/YbcL family Raf kinase inhibitor-like protein [Longimicrobiaceae bacterium]|nr:YbhB/YbcL family Raf kinase inhibitor-like protein [Longimicrobiaceae bacterium]